MAKINFQKPKGCPNLKAKFLQLGFDRIVEIDTDGSPVKKEASKVEMEKGNGVKASAPHSIGRNAAR
ncbi:hypothetical protein FKX85_05430 [Echinicola soli]|uniref:Uncharacterized protein n=1 Tax=Echinicola soli TaxID=2591634 RepID=A0A514CFQ8_9BACT|nr:hypothetical protein FKX85_05430 [Echinicola soli]